MIVFCSACRHRQVSSAVPDGVPDAHRSHPPSPQFARPRGVSLYPVERTMRSLTTTAPTCRRTHVDRDAASSAILIKYSSHDGLIVSPCARLRLSRLVASVASIASLPLQTWDSAALCRKGRDGR